MSNCFIYALECPASGKVYYVGQTMNGLERPYSHYASHSPEVREWYRSIENEPVVRILERDPIDQLQREQHWIGEMLKRGEPLLNKQIGGKEKIVWDERAVRDFIKDKRKEFGLTQVDLSQKCGVGLRLIREIEQGKKSMRVDKLLQILQLFGATLIPYVDKK